MSSSTSLLLPPAAANASASPFACYSSHLPCMPVPLLRLRQHARVSTRTSSCNGAQRSFSIIASDSAKRVVPYASYVVPIDDSAGSSFITRPLAEILRDMNKRVPDKVISERVDEDGTLLKFIPWYHANRMLSFYAPGWSGELRSISFSPDSKKVSVVYRVTLRGSDGEAYREASGTALLDDIQGGDPVQKAEGIAFSRACARFGLGLYLYHADQTQ
ncbi:hypothetical protein O6H91_15G031200 [Diphasiastrum complanatum]|nr:hypothetical protein O6H91_15G031200 [Diphasiastrum complanatum]